MAHSEVVRYEKEPKSKEQKQTETVMVKHELEKLKSQQEEEKAKQRKFKAAQINMRNRTCILIFLSVVMILAGAFWVYFIKGVWGNMYDWKWLIFASITTLSFTAIIIFLANLLKRLVLHSYEE